MRFRVAVIDDDESFRSLVVANLKADFDTTSACDGDEGLAMLDENPPDLVILDIQMPRMDGLGVLRSIRADAKLTSLPVVVLTADASRETVIAAINAGANDYLIKTAFTSEELTRKIRRALKADQIASATQAATPAVETTSDSNPESEINEMSAAMKEADLQTVLDAWE